MVAVGSRPKQFNVSRCRCVSDGGGGLKTEDFSGNPRSGSSARGFIGFGEERSVMIEL